MKITVNKDSSVPLRDQIIEQISLQVASGLLESETKLPSIRALAGRLDIHYSTVTAAYNHLADVGLLEIRQGSGVRVAKVGKSREKAQDLESLIMDFLVNCCEAGYSFEEVASTAAKITDREKVEKILAVDRNEDFHSVISTELTPHFDIPVEVITTDHLLENPSLADKALVITSLYHIFAFQNSIKDRTRLVPCNIEPARLEMEQVDAMRSGTILLLVSVSETLMNMATKLVAAHRGEEVAVRQVLLTDEKELKYMIDYADLILCDSPSEKKMKELVEAPKKLSCFKLYSPSTISLIQDRLKKWG